MVLPQPLTRFDYYNDLAVVAFPSLEGESLLQTMKVTSGTGTIDLKKITGEDPEGVIVHPAEGSTSAWLQFEFDKPYEARTLTFFIAAENAGIKQPELKDFSERTSVVLHASDDGIEFRVITNINTGVEGV
jgi:hypothetical protein